jgi:hypothetical protein
MNCARATGWYFMVFYNLFEKEKKRNYALHENMHVKKHSHGEFENRHEKKIQHLKICIRKQVMQNLKICLKKTISILN